MNFRLKITVWFLFSVVALVTTLLLATHEHLDEELRTDRWDRSHPQFPGWVIHGSFTDEEVHDILGELIHVWALVGIPLVIVAAGVGYWIAMLSLRPVREINRHMKSLDWAGARHGIPTPNNDPEIAALVSSLNALLARLSRSFNEMSEFSSKVAHELRTPLTLLRMRVEKDAPNLPPDFSEDIQEEIRRLSRLVERVLLAAKADGGRLNTNPAPVNLGELLRDLREYYQPEAEAVEMEFGWNAGEDVLVIADPELLRQILHNLLGNAVRHGFGRARLRVFSVRGGETVRVLISNFIRSGSTSRTGSGLGLRLVGGLVAALPGTSFRYRRFPGVFSTRLSFSSISQTSLSSS